MKGIRILSLVFVSSISLAATPSYKVTKTIPVPGEGGWDYLLVDAPARRLFISHSTQVQVLDIDKEKIVDQIADTPGVHGIALSPDKGFISNGKEGTVTMFDRKTLKVIGKVKVGDNPDAIIYDPATQRVFTFNGKSEDATAINALTGKVDGRVALGGKPEFAVADGSGAVYVNMEEQGTMLRLDSKGLKVLATYPLAPCKEPSSLAMDVLHRRLFAGCGNKMTAILNADTGHVITTLPIGDHVDATVFDPASGRAFYSCGDGTLTVIQEDTPDTFHVLQQVTTEKGARTMAMDPQTDKVFLPTAQFGATPPATTEHPRPRPAMLPGSFKILVVDKAK